MGCTATIRPQSDAYLSLDKEAVAYVKDHVLWSRTTLSDGSRKKQSGNIDAVGYEVIDCSDENFACVEINHSVFAVPLGQAMRVGLKYQVRGASLFVAECLSESEIPSCRSAVIVSTCRVMQESGHCELGEQDAARFIGDQVTVFVYAPNLGVTAYGTGPGIPSTDEYFESALLGIASQFVLDGHVGLLNGHPEYR